MVKPNQRVSKEELEESLRAAREYARGVGPYKGRAKVFKGSRVEKEKVRRGEDVRGKLGGMDRAVGEWQTVSITFSKRGERYKEDVRAYTDPEIIFPSCAQTVSNGGKEQT